MKAVFTLTPAEGKRLIAKAVVKMPEVVDAFKNAYLVLAGGTTNAYIAQELLNDFSIKPQNATVGISCDGVLCITAQGTRKTFPNVFYKGKPCQKTIKEALSDYDSYAVVIKGANAFDKDGNIGILTGGFDGGTVPNFIGPVTYRGYKYIAPVGLEKQVESVKESALALEGTTHVKYSLGTSCGMYCLANADIVTEIEAIDMLFACEAKVVCRGGIGGNEGAVTLAVDGEDKDITDLVAFIENEIKGEKQVPGNKGDCENCHYKTCKYYGLKKDQLPKWLKA